MTTENNITEETIQIRKTAPVEDMSDEMFENGACSMQISYSVKKSELKTFLKEHPELIARNKDIDLTAYL